MAQLKDLLVNGVSRFIGNMYGNLIGNASTSDKVNHQLSITMPGSQVYTFDGSNEVSIALTESALGIGQATRLLGYLDKTPEAFSEIENGSKMYAVATGKQKSDSKHVIPLAERFSSTLSANTNQTVIPYNVSVSGNTVIIGSAKAEVSGIAFCVIPKIGDIVMMDDKEYICIQIQTNYSLWAEFGHGLEWGSW